MTRKPGGSYSAYSQAKATLGKRGLREAVSDAAPGRSPGLLRVHTVADPGGGAGGRGVVSQFGDDDFQRIDHRGEPLLARCLGHFF